MRQKWTCIGRNTEARNKSTERSEVQRWSRDNRIHGIHQHQESSLSRSSALLCIGLFSPTAKIFFLQWWEQIYWALFRLRFCSLPPSQHRTSFSLVWKISRECSHHPCLDQVSTPSVKQGGHLIVNMFSGWCSVFIRVLPGEEKSYVQWAITPAEFHYNLLGLLNP